VTGVVIAFLRTVRVGAQLAALPALFVAASGDERGGALMMLCAGVSWTSGRLLHIYLPAKSTS